MSMDEGARGRGDVPGEPPGPGESVHRGDVSLSRPAASPPGTSLEPAGLAAALGAVLERQAEEAAASRAHLRELIRAVDGLAQSHEYLGTALRVERRRSRLLVAALGVLPVVLGAAAYLVWSESRETDRRLDDLQASLATEVRAAGERHAAEREAAIRREFEDRVARLEDDAATARADLDASRRALGDERTDRSARERDAAERLARAERELSELAGYRAEVRSLRDALGAERARADSLAKSLAPLARPPETAPVETPPKSPVPPALPGRSESAAAKAATRTPEDLARVRDLLNGLLDGATGAARYRLEDLAGVSGFELLGLRVVGRDESGRVLRTIEAPRAEISVEPSGAVRWRFAEGHLVVGGRRAPFFDGTYTLTLESRFESWRDSGLTCVRLK